MNPKIPLGPCKPRTYSLDDLTVTMLKVLGDGNVSVGIRAAARFTFDCYQHNRFIPGMLIAEPAAQPPSAETPPAASPAEPPSPPA